MSSKTIVRKRRNTMQRKCLSKSLKRMLDGAPRGVIKAFLAAEQEGRKAARVSSSKPAKAASADA